MADAEEEKSVEDLVGRLVKANADVKLADDAGVAPIKAAEKRGHKKIVELLRSAAQSADSDSDH